VAKNGVIALGWETDFLKHLRSIQFAVLGAALAILVALTLTQSAKIQGAYEQYTKLEYVRTQKMTSVFLDELGTKSGVDFFHSNGQYQPTLRMDHLLDKIGKKIVFEHLELSNFSFQEGVAWPQVTERLDVMSRTPYLGLNPRLYGPGTIEDLRQVWNFAGNAFPMQVVDVELRGILIGGSPSAPEQSNHWLAESNKQHGGMSGTYYLKHQTDPVNLIAPPKWSVLIVGDKPERLSRSFWDEETEIPIRVNSVSGVSLQGEMARDVAGGLASGPFDDVFADLVSMSRGLESLSFDDLGNYLRRLRDEDSGTVSILGVELPGASVSSWGIGLLAVLQVYFFLHLLRASKLGISRVAAHHFPWVGVYQNNTERAMMFIATCAFPSAVAFFSIYQIARPAGFEAVPWQLWLSVGAATISAIGCFCAAMFLQQSIQDVEKTS